MACILSNTGIQTGCIIQASQVSQSVDAFTKVNAYDIELSGSLSLTGSTAFSSSDGSFAIEGIINATQDNILAYNKNTGGLTYQAATSLVESKIGVYYTSSNSAYEFEIVPNDTTNSATGSFSAIVGGNNNCIGSGDFESTFSTIGGGCNNQIKAGSSKSYIGGGAINHISSSCAVIGGGECNEICIDRPFSAILGGCKNIIEDGDKTGTPYCAATIVGGISNKIEGYGQNFIGGGNNNSVSNGYGGVIVGGTKNCVSCDSGFIGGGGLNSNSGNYSSIPGGCSNCVKHDHTHILGSDITTCVVCTTHVNNLLVGCTICILPRDPIGTGATGMLAVCDLGGGRSKLYYHDGLTYKEVCLVP